MRIELVTPAPAASHHGNRITAGRWADLLRELGHTVTTGTAFDPGTAEPEGTLPDLVVALHARRSAPSVLAAAAARVPVVVALTGTDLYPDLHTAGVDPAVLAAADRIVVLQPLALDQLPERLRERTSVLTQSAQPASHPTGPSGPAWPAAPGADEFRVVVLAHLRAVKDPLLPAAAARLLPADSCVRILHAGAVIEPRLGAAAQAEAADNARYRWLGDLPHVDALALLASSRMMLHPSRHEGGANVVSEALAAGIPVLASRIPGSEGLLGAGYPGSFPVADAAALAEALSRAEHDTDGYYQDLLRATARLRPLVAPDREREVWRQLLAELAPGRDLRP